MTTTTTQFFKDYRAADAVTQKDIQRIADGPQSLKRRLAVLFKQDPFYEYLADNPQVNSRYLAKSLIGTEAAK